MKSPKKDVDVERQGPTVETKWSAVGALGLAVFMTPAMLLEVPTAPSSLHEPQWAGSIIQILR